MTNDPSKFFMIDGPLAPQGSVESHIVSLRRRRESITAQEVIDHMAKECRRYCEDFDRNMPVGTICMRPFEVMRYIEEIELAVAQICDPLPSKTEEI